METASKKIRVLIIDDSAFMRKVISDILKTEESIEIVDTARNGKDAIEKARLLKPDFITLDVEMPIMDGLTALPELMKITPTPKVIMVSSLTYNGAEETIKALELGAIDFVTKSNHSNIDANIEALKIDLIKKMQGLSKPSITNYTFKKSDITSTLSKIEEKPSIVSAAPLKYIIAIGVSTGGPRALQDVIPQLPADIPAAILIVQHMPPGFTNSLAKRLDHLSKIHVKEAEDGDVLKAGCAYLAPGDYHMNIGKANYNDYKILINQNPLVSGHRPSVNAMMDSVADTGHKHIIAVMMTGMGSDGSTGIKKIKQMGGKTIAQNEETCVVYGMPKAAVNAGAIDSIVPLEKIPSEILKLMGGY